MKWIEDVKYALVELDGRAHLSEIYKIVRINRTKRGETTGELEAWIRHTLQQNSRGQGENIFESAYPVQMRKGIWKL